MLSLLSMCLIDVIQLIFESASTDIMELYMHDFGDSALGMTLTFIEAEYFWHIILGMTLPLWNWIISRHSVLGVNITLWIGLYLVMASLVWYWHYGFGWFWRQLPWYDTDIMNWMILGCSFLMWLWHYGIGWFWSQPFSVWHWHYGNGWFWRQRPWHDTDIMESEDFGDRVLGVTLTLWNFGWF